MFTFTLKTIRRCVSRVPENVLVRNLRGGRLGPNVNVGQNPGLDNRLKAFNKDGIKINDEDVEEFMEQSNSDLYMSGEAYNAHVNETLMGKYILRHQVVKEKYFKENMPNLLTWSEKEQIRHLCNEHPDEWTPETIAESFPVTVPVVKKLLKFPWKPASPERIERHDNSAMRNWRDLKDGLLDIPEEVRQHFLKFSARKIPPLKKESMKIDVTPDENMGEFQRIIDKCASKETHSTKSSYYENIEESETENNHNKQQSKEDKQLMTLDDLASKIKHRLDKGKNIDLPDQMIMRTVQDIEDEPSNNDIELPAELSQESKQVTVVKKKEEVTCMASYPERIRIPKKSYQKGATYKVNDCYYDDDGKFLYRVIGMKS